MSYMVISKTSFGRYPNSDVTLSETYKISPFAEKIIIKPSNASSIRWMNSSLDKKGGFQSSFISSDLDFFVISSKETKVTKLLSIR